MWGFKGVQMCSLPLPPALSLQISGISIRNVGDWSQIENSFVSHAPYMQRTDAFFPIFLVHLHFYCDIKSEMGFFFLVAFWLPKCSLLKPFKLRLRYANSTFWTHLNVLKNFYSINLNRNTFCSCVSSCQVHQLSLFSFLCPFPVSILLFYQPSSFVSPLSKQQNTSLCYLEKASEMSCLTWNPAIRDNLSVPAPPQHLASNAYFSNMQSGSQLYFRLSILCPQDNSLNPQKERLRATWQDPPFPIINITSQCSYTELQLWKQGHYFLTPFPSACAIRIFFLI